MQRVAQRSKDSTYRAASSVTGPARQEQQRGGSGRAHGLPNFNFWRWSSQNEWRVLLVPNSASQERRPDRSALHAQLVAAVSRCWSAALSNVITTVKYSLSELSPCWHRLFAFFLKLFCCPRDNFVSCGCSLAPPEIASELPLLNCSGHCRLR